jgi:hypothetical protein
MPRFLRSFALAAMVGVAATALGVFAGCAARGQGRFARSETIAGGTLTQTTLAAVDIVNPNGTVHVIVDPDEPAARWEVNLTADGSVPPATLDSLRATGVQGQVVVEGGRTVVKIRPTQELLDTPGVYVDLEVRMPSVRGVHIRSSGGPIVLSNVSGPMSITNGLQGGPGGNVIVRTNEPLTDPIWIDTPAGNIDLFMPPQSRGVFALRSDDGTADFYAVRGKLDGVRPTRQTWNGTLNDGTNEVVLRSGRGRVRGMVDANPDAPWRGSNEPRDWNP